MRIFTPSSGVGYIDFVETLSTVEHMGIGVDMAGANKMYFTSSGASGVPSSTTAKVTMQGDGNVGIGTTTPLSALHVNGTLVAGGTARTLVDSNDTAYFENNNNYTQFHMYNSGATVNAYVSINKNGNLAYGSGGNPTTPAMNIWTGSAHPVRFGTNNAQAMIIDSSQNVGIG